LVCIVTISCLVKEIRL